MKNIDLSRKSNEPIKPQWLDPSVLCLTKKELPMLTRGLNLELPEEASDESETENDRNGKAGKQKQKIVETLLTYEPPKTVSL